MAPFLASAPAHAQASRTWVSGVGDDANPCSRSGPCKTFAGAISKTAAAGEIDCLDPGGFGGITITKAITLNCSATLGSILVAGTNGITVAAGASDIVVIRGLQLLGANVGLIGIQINSGLAVSIENCTITQFTKQGVHDARTAGNTKLFIRTTVISHNTLAGLSASATGPNNVEIEDTSSINNSFEIATGTGNSVMARRSVFAGNTNSGVETDGGGSLNVDNSAISSNVTGVQANGTIRLSNSDVAFNGTGITGTATSYGNNRISGNASAGTAPIAASPGEQ